MIIYYKCQSCGRGNLFAIISTREALRTLSSQIWSLTDPTTLPVSIAALHYSFTEAVHEEKWEEASMLQGALLNLVSSTSDFFLILTDPFK